MTHAAGEEFAAVWPVIEPKLRAWLSSKRFVARPQEVPAVLAAATAELSRDDWHACRSEASGTGAAATERLLMAAFSRAVRAIEVSRWSQLILGQDHVNLGKDHRPAGPLSLSASLSQRLPAPWNSDDAAISAIVQEQLGELALAGWAALGGYGLHTDPALHFLEQLQRRLSWHGSWEAVLNHASVAEGLPLLTVLEQQALKEFSDPADGSRAFHWAIDHLVRKKFTAPNISPVHEVRNPQAFLRKAFATALVEFRRTAWRPGQIQRPRPDTWMQRLLSQDWIDVFHLSVRHARTQSVVESFMVGEHRGTVQEDQDQAVATEPALLDARRMTDEQRRYQERALQIEAEYAERPAARIQAIAIWCRSYLEQVKQWVPVAPDLSLFIEDGEGEQSERALPAVECTPLTELLCAEDRMRLLATAQQADRSITQGSASLDERLRAFTRTLLGPALALTTEQIATLRRIVDPPAPRRGRPPKDADKAQLLEQLRQAAQACGLDTSIFDSVSVLFPSWNGDAPEQRITSAAEAAHPHHGTTSSGDLHDTP